MNGQSEWLAGAACSSRAAVDGSIAASTVGVTQLGRQQKRDLLSMAGVAVATSALTLVPLMGGPAAAPTLPATTLDMVLVSAPSLPATDLPSLRITRRSSPAAARRSPRTPPGVLAAPAARPEPSRLGSQPQVPAQVQLLAPEVATGYRATVSAPASKPRRVVRILFGSGRHKVQPFPSPSADN